MLVGHICNQFEQFRILAKEILANVGTTAGHVGLVVAIQTLVHALDQQAGFVALQQRVPIAAPDDLYDVPTASGEHRFQFLNDLAVAAHRAVETLQIAVDHEDQIVEAFVGGNVKRRGRFRLIRFAVAHEDPNLARARRE